MTIFSAEEMACRRQCGSEDLGVQKELKGRKPAVEQRPRGEGLGRRLEGDRQEHRGPVGHSEKLMWYQIQQEIIQRFGKRGTKIQLASLKDHSGI